MVLKGDDSLLGALLFPRRCLACRAVIREGMLCDKCTTALSPVIPPLCLVCGQSLNHCQCSTENITLPHLAASFHYEGLVRKAIHSYKFFGMEELAPFFAEKMADTAAAYYPIESFDFVCCVPMARSERRSRPFDHSALLAACVADKLGMKVINDALVKIRMTARQHRLSVGDRLVNPCGAFAVNEKRQEIIRGKTILLCDDIKTTGATLNECCRVLFAAGAADVWCLCTAVSAQSE